MNDQVLMDNYLMILKSTVEVYVHGTLESCNNDIRKLLKSGLDETLKHQSRTYDKMTEYGWYKVDNVKQNSISQVLKKIEKNS